jgi:serine/threonine-protein kinase
MSSTTAILFAQAAYVPGYVIAGKYALEAELGEGGMGVVWRARNLDLDAPVAIKLLRTDESRKVLGSRLLQEARAAARLGHASIVRVFDVGYTEGGDPFLVMELLSGQSLGALLEDGPLEATRVVQILLPIADALSVAHAKGFVHRDLKPDNVFVSESDGQVQPKLLDFGIVKVTERPGHNKLTLLGTILGSPDYMSPEQARGRDDIDYRSDIWSFCVTLYQCVSGYLPFEGDNANELLQSIVEAPPAPLSEHECDVELWRIIERGLAKNRDARFRSMNQLGSELADWLRKRGVYEDACGKPLQRNRVSTPAEQASRRELESRKTVPQHPIENDANATITLPARDHVANPTTVKPVMMSNDVGPARKERQGLQRWSVLGGLALLGTFAGVLVGFALLGRGDADTAAPAAATTFAQPLATSTALAQPKAAAIDVLPAENIARSLPVTAPSAPNGPASRALTTDARNLGPLPRSPVVKEHVLAVDAGATPAASGSAAPEGSAPVEASADPAGELINAY